MMVLVIVLTVALLILIAVVIVKLNSEKSERDKYYTAAGNIIKEEYLNYCLTNDMNSDNKADAPNGQKIMIYIKTLNRKQKAQFVFDPEKGVNIGRDSEKNNIFINEASVSMNHCKIFSDSQDTTFYAYQSPPTDMSVPCKNKLSSFPNIYNRMNRININRISQMITKSD